MNKKETITPRRDKNERQLIFHRPPERTGRLEMPTHYRLKNFSSHRSSRQPHYYQRMQRLIRIGHIKYSENGLPLESYEWGISRRMIRYEYEYYK